MTLTILAALGCAIAFCVGLMEIALMKDDMGPDLLEWAEKQPSPPSADIGNPITPEAARDADLALVAGHNADWMAAALRVIQDLPSDFRGLGEDIGSIVRARVGEPSSPNAWGALIARAKKRQLISPTGEMAPMKGAKSNARMSFVYVKCQMAEAAE